MEALRRFVVPLGVLAGAIVLYLSAPWDVLGLSGLEPSEDVFTLLSIVFWVLAILIFVLAWKVAGYYGVDRWLLPRLGVPWHARVLSPAGEGFAGSR